MEHHLSAPSDGVVGELLVVVGQQVDNGTTLLVLDVADADADADADTLRDAAGEQTVDG